MMFVHPSFLWALLAVLIPIIIHLFNFRRYKKIYFSNVHFLKELQIESQSKSRLKEILILIARILAIAALVFAFAQPVLSNKKTGRSDLKNKIVGIYIDNSFSMEGVNKQGPLIESAKKAAKSIVNSFGSNDRFALLTNDFEGKHQRIYSKEDILNEINDVKISPSVKLYSEVLKRQSDFLNSQGKNIRLFALSDLQRSSFNIDKINHDTADIVNIIPLEANETNNIYIDTCWFESPIQQKDFIQKLHLIIVNSSQKPLEAGNAKLFINNAQVSMTSFSIDANSKAEVSMNFTCKNSGLNYASVKIDDYPISFDDELFFTFNSKLVVNTIVINGKECSTGEFFRSLLSSDSLFKFSEQQEQSIDYSNFKNADCIILNELQTLSSGLLDEITKFSGKGGSVVIIPSKTAAPDKYNSFYTSLGLPSINQLDTHALKLNKPEFNNPFFEGVFEKLEKNINTPNILQHFSHAVNSRNSGQRILDLQNGDFFLSRYNFRNSNIFLFSSSLDNKQSNFVKHALFVPAIIKMAISSLKPVPLFYWISTNNLLQLKSEGNVKEEPPHLKGYKKPVDIIPELRMVNDNILMFVGNQVNEAGFFNIEIEKQVKQNIAFNFNRNESDLYFYTAEEITSLIDKNGLKNFSVMNASENSNISQALLIGSNGVKLWKWFVLASLLFFAIEIVLIRFIK